MYDEFVDKLEDIHNNGVEILVVSNLNARIELEFSMYEIYKVIDLEKNDQYYFHYLKSMVTFRKNHLKIDRHQ